MSMRRTVIYIVLSIFAFFSFFSSPASAAGTLGELRDQLAAYQSEPQARAGQLESELAKIREVEEGLSRQYDVKISDIIQYEYDLEWLIDTYYSLYLLQKRGNAKNTFIIDDAGIGQLSQKKPPYTFSFYARVVSDLAACTRENAGAVSSAENAKKQLLELRAQKLDIEREYRLTREKTLLSTEDRVKYNFRLIVLKARLERAIADYTYYEFTLKLSDTLAADTKAKMDSLTAILKNIKDNIKPDPDNYEYLDSLAFSQSKKLHDTIKTLEEKFDDVSTMRHETVRPTPFAKYWMLTEQDLLEDEMLFTLDIIEYWAAVRMGWRSYEELVGGKLTISDQKELRSRTEDLIQETQDSLDSANKELQKIRSAGEEVERRFTDDDHSETSADERIKDEFLENIEARKQRYLGYMITLGAMNTQFGTLKSEIDRLIGEADTKDKLSGIIDENAASMLDYELWSIGDYPITVRKFGLAVIIFMIGYFITKCCVREIKRRNAAHPSLTPHSALLIEKCLLYTGLVISFLVALWMLHIPLTAFAFMGGAAAIAIGLGTQKMMGDVLSGILLLFQKKVRIGDDVIIGGTEGIVTEITLQNTVLLCEQSKYMIIPNSKVLDSSVLNLTLNGPKLRTQVSVAVDSGTDTEQVSSVIRKVLADDKLVLKSPAPRLIFSEASETGITVTAIFFMDIKKHMESDVQSEVRMSILEAFRRDGIKFPTQRRDIRVIK